jgi:hypothetical protein
MVAVCNAEIVQNFLVRLPETELLDDLVCSLLEPRSVIPDS